MKENEIIIKILTDKFSTLKDTYKIKSLGIFGSYKRNTQKKGSDVDLLVEFEAPIGLIEFVAIERQLSHILKSQLSWAGRMRRCSQK